jgi:hypothetical protein
MSHAVMVQVTPAVVVCWSDWMTGRTGTTSDWSVAKEPTLSARMAKVRPGWDRDIVGRFPFLEVMMPDVG